MHQTNYFIMKNINFKKHSTFILLFLISVCLNAQVAFNFSTANRGPYLGNLHYGIFYEEINHGGDGGLYAELIRNRSFEDNEANPDCWWGLGGMKMELVKSGLMNSAQSNALKLTVNEYNAGIRNEGFWGMNIENGKVYTLTFWAKTDGEYKGKIWAELQNDNFENLGRTEFDVALTSTWKKFTVNIKATSSNTKGWLAIKGLEPMVIYLDVVSLMPPTFKNRVNGCRPDLAQFLANLKPKFVRFPGGCYVEGTYQDGKTNRFEWKKTIGPIEERPGHLNVNWGYRVSDGFGFHELLQFTEDIGAEPLFVCNIGLGHGWNEDYNNINDFIQEALDAIEYCNGGVNTTYGAMRAANGHPNPFNLRLIEIGNENYNFIPFNNADMSDHYAERYAAFYKAIKAKYPEMILIGNVESWATDTPSWRNENPVEIVDEHYYRSTDWFKQQYNKYDYYDRNSNKVYVGEYAVTSNYGAWGNLNAALSEAIYMLGMERNSDICTMTSYAPIFCNENHPGPWMPDLIRFNAYDAFGTPSYWVQNLMSNNVGYQNILWTEKGNAITVGNTAVGLSSWGTSVSFDNFSITDSQGNIIYKTDFSSSDDYTLNWNAGGGTWNINGGTLNQTNTSMFGDCNVCYNYTGDNCVIELDATKKSGTEGFLIAFSFNDPNNYVWWNLGGWGNTRHAIEQSVDGVKTILDEVNGNIETGKNYHLKIIKAIDQLYCYVDDSLYHHITLTDSKRIFASAALDQKEDSLVLKFVNPSSVTRETSIHFNDFQYNGKISLNTLSSNSGNDENTMQNKFNVTPKYSTFTPAGNNPNAFIYDLPPYSLSVMKVPIKNVTEQSSDDDDLDGWIDITDKLTNSNFAQGQTGWNGTKFTNAPGTVAEFFNTNFNVYQSLNGLPSGYYKFTIDGFYRNGEIVSAYNKHIQNTEQLNTLMYIMANGETIEEPLVSLYDKNAPYYFNPEYTYPDNITAANIAFNMKNAYKHNEIIYSLPTNNSSLRIGLKKTLSTMSDWACFDNVHLYYKPFESVVDNIEDIKVKNNTKNGVYDLTGKKIADEFDLNKLEPGFYIINGNKVLIK